MTKASGFENGDTGNGTELADGWSLCSFVLDGASVTPFGCASTNGFVPIDGTLVKTADVDSFVAVIGTKMELIRLLT